MTETVDVFYQETNYVTLLIFWLLIDVYFLLLHVSFIFECLVYIFFIHYSVLCVQFFNKIITTTIGHNITKKTYLWLTECLIHQTG